MIANYDQEIEKRYHPENFDELVKPMKPEKFLKFLEADKPIKEIYGVRFVITPRKKK